MTTQGDRFGKQGLSYAGVGVGVPISPQQLAANPYQWQYVSITDFSGGYNSSTIDERVKPGSSPFMIDMAVDKRGRLGPTPGIVQRESLTHTPSDMFAHPALNSTVDVVLIAPPFMGVRALGITTWYNVSLPAGAGWVAALHGDKLLLSNNAASTDIFYRDPTGVTVTALGWGEAGTLLSFVGRVFALNCNIGGTPNPLGVKWTGASGLITDLVGVGAGFELLLRDSSENDKIVAARELGFDLMVILMRKSLWIGVPTGDVNRPVDFRPRVIGSGAINESTCRTVEGGVMYLSDDGVKFFDGNAVTHRSYGIDNDILPIDYANLTNYSASYTVESQDYILHTPTATWIYQLVYDRWIRLSAIISRSLSVFNPFTQNFLGLLPGWGSYWNGFWSDYPPGGVVSLSDDTILLKGNVLGGFDATVRTYFGVPFTSVWTSPRQDGESMNSLVVYDRFDTEYDCAGSATASFSTPDIDGVFGTSTFSSVALVNATRKHIRAYWNKAASGVGRGLSSQISVSGPDMFKLYRVGCRFKMVPESLLP